MSIDERLSIIQKKKESDYLSCRSEWQYFWQQALTDTRFEAADGALAGEMLPNMPTNNTYNLNFNHIRPVCNMISGYQRNNRKSSIVVPVDNSSQETADQWTKILMQIYKNENVYEKISDAFHRGSLINGLSLLQVYLDFSHDPINGDLKIKQHHFSSVIFDTNLPELNLENASFLTVRTYMSPESVCYLLPQQREEILSLNTGINRGTKNAKFEFMPQSLNRNMTNLMAYDEYYYRTYRDQALLIDKETCESHEVALEDTEYTRKFLQENPNIALIEKKIPTVRLAISVQDQVLWEGPQNNIDCYPFAIFHGYYAPELSFFAQRLQSVVRSARDPQLLFNRRLIINAEIAESLPSSGYIFRQESLVDVNQLFNTGPGRFIAVKKGAQMTDIVPIPPPQIPPEFFTIQESAAKEINMVTGANEELMGSAVDDKAGVLSMLRQGAGLVTLQVLFDSLDHTQILLSEIIMAMVRANYSPAKIKTIIGVPELTPFFYNKEYGRYRCTVESGFMTETQRQYEFIQLYKLKAELGLDIPDDVIIKAATLQNKSDLIQSMEQRAQAAQQAAQVESQYAQQLQQSQAELAASRAHYEHAGALEREARVQQDKASAVERIAEAEREHEVALLNKVKMLKEIESLDIQQLEKLITLATMLKSSTVSQSAQTAENL